MVTIVKFKKTTNQTFTANTFQSKTQNWGAHVDCYGKPTKEDNFSQPLQTHIKQFKFDGTFLIGWNGMFKATTKNKKFFVISVFQGAEDHVFTIPAGIYDKDALKKEIKRIENGEWFIKEKIIHFPTNQASRQRMVL